MTAWGTSTVGDEFSVQLGKRVDAAVARGVPKVCINNRGVRWGYIDPSVAAVELLNDADIRELRLIEGDLLVCEGGEIGRSSVWRGELSEAYYLNTLHRLRPKQGYEPELAAAFLEYFVATGALLAIVGKSSLAHLTKENLLRVPLPVPPAAEQSAIATALRSADDLNVSLERLIAKKRDVKQGMMQELLTGRTRLPGFSGDWRMEQLREVTTIDPESLSPLTTPRTEEIDYIALEDVSRGVIFGSTRIEFGDAPSRARRAIRDGDVLFGTVRPNLQSHGIYRGCLGNPVASTGFAVIRYKGGLSDSNFLAQWILSDVVMSQVDRIIAGSNYPAVSSADVRAFEIHLPTIDEQRAIGQVLADADAEIEALERRLESARAVKVGMMQELLTGRTRLRVTEEA